VSWHSGGLQGHEREQHGFACAGPGGIGTIHAGSGIGALRRLEQLIQEAVVTVPRALIAETIDIVAVLSGRGSARRLAELARVEGLGPDGDYRITPATNPKGDPS